LLECRGLVVAYGDHQVLDGVDLQVAPGETLAVLGPSGSGKTTLLYAVAGFLRPQAGTIVMDGVAVAGPQHSEPPETRRVGMVFQNYALWPHLTALEIVQYPLRRAGKDTAAAAAEAQALLDAVGIGHLSDRDPSRLSGGEQQRVGLARALARRARLFLFDEPTAHLDTPLRAALQLELQARRRELEAAAVYATHDAAEALAVADRMALLRDGRVAQVAPPTDVYERPVDLWAARLTGSASHLRATVTNLSAGKAQLALGDTGLSVAADWADGVAGGEVDLVVRPEWASLDGPLPATVDGVSFRGAHTDYHLDTPHGVVELRHPGRPQARAGERVTWQLRRVWLPGS
jgi:ABC-type Fe3+/spermidine/putrescine transport system ATPase subunit